MGRYIIVYKYIKYFKLSIKLQTIHTALSLTVVAMYKEEETSFSNILPGEMASGGWCWQPIAGQYTNTWATKL